MSKERHLTSYNLGTEFASCLLKFIEYALVCSFLNPTDPQHASVAPHSYTRWMTHDLTSLIYYMYDFIATKSLMTYNSRLKKILCIPVIHYKFNINTIQYICQYDNVLVAYCKNGGSCVRFGAGETDIYCCCPPGNYYQFYIVLCIHNVAQSINISNHTKFV